MSDPVTNVDIEDVLASIRRLVLQGGPTPPAPATGRGRLVLTQALRVAEPREDEEAAAVRHGVTIRDEPPHGSAESAPFAEGGSEAQPDAEPPREPQPVLVLSAPMAVGGRATDLRGIEAALSDAPEFFEPDGSEELDWSLGGVAEAATPVFRHRAPGAPVTPRPAGEAPPGIDDSRLRAMVTEVLRAELQGELGERMTRNIRRLVRREIFRVLETRDDE